nr:TIGR02757 family protein [Bacteroidota bacterium]
VIDYAEETKSAEQIRLFVHRTFNGLDLNQFLISLQHVYRNLGGLEEIFAVKPGETDVYPAITRARESFFEMPHLQRAEKHFSNPATGSAAKRLSMFLRWMVRQGPVDFGIWKNISPSHLICPLDVHSGNVARKLGLLQRKQNDRKAAEELTQSLALLCPEDPVKYDIALFGLGVFEKF